MVVPQVSHRNWWLTRANTQIALGTMEVDPRELRFEDCISTITPGPDRMSYRERLNDKHTYKLPEWDAVEIEWEAGDTSRPHRPDIEGDVEEWTEMVQREWLGVPVEKLSFDRKLELLLTRRHEYLNHVIERVRIVNATTGEVVVGPSEDLPTVDTGATT